MKAENTTQKIVKHLGKRPHTIRELTKKTGAPTNSVRAMVSLAHAFGAVRIVGKTDGKSGRVLSLYELVK